MKRRFVLCWLALLAPMSCVSTMSRQSPEDPRATNGSDERARAVVSEGEAQEETTVRPGGLSVSRPRFARELDGNGQPLGPTVTVLSSGADPIHCVFTVSGAQAGTDVEVHWITAGREVLTNRLGQVDGARELVATLAVGEALVAGLYRVEIVANGAVVRSASFLVEEARPDESFGPRVANLVLTTAIDPSSGLPMGPTLEQIRGDEPVLYASLTFSRMPPGTHLEVVWFDDAVPGEPIATSTFEVSGRGSLAASLELGDPLLFGPHHVEVRAGGGVVATLRFEVDRPEGHPREVLVPP